MTPSMLSHSSFSCGGSSGVAESHTSPLHFTRCGRNSESAVNGAVDRLRSKPMSGTSTPNSTRKSHCSRCNSSRHCVDIMQRVSAPKAQTALGSAAFQVLASITAVVHCTSPPMCSSALADDHAESNCPNRRDEDYITETHWKTRCEAQSEIKLN